MTPRKVVSRQMVNRTTQTPVGLAHHRVQHHETLVERLVHHHPKFHIFSFVLGVAVGVSLVYPIILLIK